MADVHPHWHTTEETAPAPEKAAVAAPVVDEELLMPPADAVVVSRKPAAIVGIVLVLTIGFALFQGVGGLIGQIATGPEKVLIRITKTGFDPNTLTVKPGQQITWKNEDTIPHILASDTLKTDKGEALQTSPIFKDAEVTVTLAADISPGDYDYASRTKSDFKAKVTVALPSPPAPPAVSSASSEAAPAASSAASSQGAALPTVPEPQVPGAPEAPVPPAPTPPGGIPENPFSVGSPAAATTASTKSPLTGQMIPSSPLMQNTKTKPASQPGSGPGAVWVLGIVAAGILLVGTRNAFRA